MADFWKKILILTASPFFLINKGNTQISSPLNPDQFNLSKGYATTLEGDSIFLYFLVEAFKYQFFEVDNLFPKIQKEVDEFLSKYKRDTLEDVEYSKREFVKTIFNKIQHIKVIAEKEEDNQGEVWPTNYKKIKEEKLKEVRDIITVLPSSKEKVWLLLRYMNIEWEIDSNDIFRANCYKIHDSAKLITDSFELGMAYLYIGDFASEYNYKDIAISTYYLAKECFYNSSRDDSTKLSKQGVIDEKIADMIQYMGVVQSQIKASNYRLSAAEYFQKAGDIDNYNKNFSVFLEIRSALLPHLDYYYNERMMYYQPEENILKYLQNWYHDFQNKKNGAEKTSDINFRSIGIILRDNEAAEEALPYFLYALQAALKAKNIWSIFSILEDVAYTYSIIGKEKLSIAYADLAISVGDITGYQGDYFYYHALLSKGSCFHELKKYDSAKSYIDEVLFSASPRVWVEKVDSNSTGFPIVYESEPYSEIIEWASMLKGNILTILKSDSAWGYIYDYEGLRVRHLKEFSQLLQVETEAVTSWLSRELTITQKQKEKVEVLNKKISNQNGWLLLVLVILIISLSGLVIFIVKYRRQSRRLKRNLNERITYLNERIALKNLKTHEIKELVNNLPLIWKGVEKEPVSTVIGNAIIHTKLISEYLKTIFELNIDNVSPVSRQIELAKIYSETFKRTRLTNNYVIRIVNNIRDDYVLQELPVPTLLLNNFIKNSIEHGFDDEKQTELEIIINCLNTPTGFSIMIEDNGCGINYSKRRTVTPGEGIQFAKETINVFNSYNRQYMINFSDDSVFDKQIKNKGRGTIVIIEFVKR